MFQSATAFNQPIGNWPLSASSINMSQMFYNATTFNQDIGSWDVSKVTSMFWLFQGATNFNNSGSNSINNWRPISCSEFEAMFLGTSFNQPIGDWTLATDRNINLARMFRGNTAFNQDITTWNTSRVTRMDNTFDSATSFNQPIGTWDTSNVTLMDNMFAQATAFNQDIGSWNVGKVINFTGFMSGKTTYSYLHTIYDGWVNNKLQPNRTITFNTIKYSGSAAEGRGLLTRTYNTASIIGSNDDTGQIAITCSANHNVVAGNKIFISGSSYTGINGVRIVDSTGSSTTLTIQGVPYDPAATDGLVTTGYGWNITDGGVV
jgi:surface protein